MNEFKIGDLAKASAAYHMHGIIPGKEYDVKATNGDMLLVATPTGNLWKRADSFQKVKKAKEPRKMKFDAPCIGEYIIGSLHPVYGFSAVAAPKPHTTEGSARTECERLTKEFPEKKFVYMKIEGAVFNHGVTWE